jgi:hypothetical protein
MHEDQRFFSLFFSIPELVFVTQALGLERLIGVEDPLMGASAEQLQVYAKQASDTLRERGFLENLENGQIALDGAIATLVTPIGMGSTPVLIASRAIEEGHLTMRFVHLHPELIVEQEAVEDDQIVLTGVRDAQVLSERLLGYLCLPEREAAPGEAISLSAEDLAEAQRLAARIEECSEFLSGSGIPKDAANNLASALAQQQGMGSVSLGVPDDQSELHVRQSVAWLIGPDGAWRILTPPDDADTMVQLLPVSTETLISAIAELVVHADDLRDEDVLRGSMSSNNLPEQAEGLMRSVE